MELQQLVSEQNRLEKEKSDRLAQQSSFESDYNIASAERDKTEQTVRRMRLEQQDTDQPKILDYIKIKHEVMVSSVDLLSGQLCQAQTLTFKDDLLCA